MSILNIGDMSTNKDCLKKLDEMFLSSRYLDIMDSCKNFNRVLLHQRKRCVPFIDQHTGLAQSDCTLWKQARERMPALSLGQVFTYPAKRWMKRKRQHMNPPVSIQPKLVPEEGSMPITTVENPTFQESMADDDTKESWYYDLDKEDDFEEYSDHSDYDFGDRHRRKKATTPRRSRSSRSSSSRRRPVIDGDMEESPRRSKSSRSRQSQHHPAPILPPPPPPTVLPQLAESVEVPPVQNPIGVTTATTTTITTNVTQVSSTTSPEKKRSKPSLYCDFCLGDASQNKKTGSPEELVSCADCGRSGHPSCLQFTGNMIISVKKYRWQCIECKCCSLCGTSDNDEQLLFCDDCDRGYHMYCLKPPLSEPPEGSWSCSLCMAEFHQPRA